MSAQALKPSQRERLVLATIELAASKGYGQLSVAELATLAGVSRSTFYELFKDKEDCFLAAFGEASSRMLEQMSAAAQGSECSQAPSAALGAQLEWIEREPAAAWLLMVEGMAGPPRVRSAHKQLMERYGHLTDELFADPSQDRPAPDLPPLALAGGVRSVVTSALAVNAPDRVPRLADPLLQWMRSYSVPAERERWSVGPNARLSAALEPLTIELPEILGRPEPLPRGNHGLPATLVSRNQRTRLLHATAEAALSKGYLEMTVADIVAGAGVARDVFYAHFPDKRDAFLETERTIAHAAIAASSRAFFAASSWPERMWNWLQALAEMIAANPAPGNLVIVESFAAGREANRSIEELIGAARLFLEEGFHQSAQAAARPRLFSEAIVGALCETLFDHLSQHEPRELPQRVPELTYIAIAPFIGPLQAIELIEELRAARAPPSAAVSGDR